MSLQKTSLPAFLMFAGGAIATAGVVLVVGALVVVAAFLLPPQPAARTATRARTASPAADGIFIRFMLGPFLCGSWAPSLDELAGRMLLASFPDFFEVRLPNRSGLLLVARRSGGTGRRAGLKIRWGSRPVWVRLPPSALRAALVIRGLRDLHSPYADVSELRA